MLENKMVVDSQWRNQEQPKHLGFENALSQPECCGSDFYCCEVLAGDEIAIDTVHCDEMILKDHLQKYLEEEYNFVFQGRWVVDKSRNAILHKDCLEKYLADKYNFKFLVAD